MEPQHPGAEEGRNRGAQQRDPVRLAYLEALARRARGQSGVLRQLLDARLAQVGYELRRLQAGEDPGALHPRTVRLAKESTVSALTQLVHRLDGQPGTDGHSIADGRSAPAGSVNANASGAASPVHAHALRELRTAQRFRATWTRLRIDEQLVRSQRQAPQNPGPLNSHLLVLRALHQLREQAPAYLERLMAHTEVLTWLADAQWPNPAGPGAPAARDRRKGKAKKAGS